MRKCVYGQLWANATPISQIASSYPSDSLKSKLLNHVICLWLSRFLTLSMSGRPKPYCFRSGYLNWRPKSPAPLTEIRQTSVSLKLKLIVPIIWCLLSMVVKLQLIHSKFDSSLFTDNCDGTKLIFKFEGEEF